MSVIDEMTAELGDIVDAQVTHGHWGDREIRAEVVKVFNNGKLRVRDEHEDGDEYTITPENAEVISKAM